MNLPPNASPAPASPNIPYPPAQPAAAKRSRLFYIGLAGVVVGGICCILGVVALVAYAFMSKKAAPAVSLPPIQAPIETALPPTLTSLPVSQPTDTSLPASTPTDTSLPAAPASPTPQGPGGNAPQFIDNFSDPSSGWAVGSTGNSEASYNTSGFYEMAVKTASYYSISIAPDSLPRPLKNVIITVRAQGAVGNTGEYGVVCGYQDIQNFYLAGISGNKFYIGKQVNGEWTYLTDPEMQPLSGATPDAENYHTLGLSCSNSFIVLDVDGIGQAHVTDDTFSSGDVGLCVWAGDSVDKFGYYARAGFDDFLVKMSQP